MIKKTLMFLIVFCLNLFFWVEVKSQTIDLHNEWKFKQDNEQKGYENGYYKFDFDDTNWKTIKVPAPWGKQGYPDCMFGWYRKKFTIDKRIDGKIVMLKAGELADKSSIYLNGELICETVTHTEEIDINITDKVRYGKDNVLAISIFNSYRSENMYWGGIRGYITIEHQNKAEKVNISNDEIKTGKYPESYKVNRKDGPIQFWLEMICDYGSIDHNYVPTCVEDMDMYLKDIGKAVDVVSFEVRYSDPKILEKYYPSIITNNKPDNNNTLLNFYSYESSTALKDIYVPYSEFDKYPDKAEKILLRIQKTIDTAHKNGLKICFSFSSEGMDLFTPVNLCGATYPGAQVEDFRKHPDYQAEVFDPVTGEFIQLTNYLDWANEEAVDYCINNVERTLRRIKDIDYYYAAFEMDFGFFRARRGGRDNDRFFKNDNSEEMKRYRDKKLYKGNLGGRGQWYLMPTYSKAALNNYRKYLKDPNAFFPATPGSAKTDRTFITDKPEDWNKWNEWLDNLYVNFINRNGEAANKTNKNNPRYKGNAVFLDKDQIYADNSHMNIDKILSAKYVDYFILELMGGRVKDRKVFESLMKIRDASEKYNKKFASWIYVVPFMWLTLDTSKDVKWVRQWYLRNLFEKNLELGAGMMYFCHLLNLNPESALGIGHNKLYRGKYEYYYDESTTEIMRILHKRYSLREKLNKDEEDIYNRAKQLPKVGERERVARILPVKNKIELDGNLKEWDKTTPYEVYAKSVVRGTLFEMNDKEEYEKNEKEFNKNPIRIYYQYDKEGIYIGIEGPTKCLKGTIHIRTNLENPDNKSDIWIKNCRDNAITMQSGRFGSSGINGYANITDGGNSIIEMYVLYKILPLGNGFEANSGRVISLGLTFQLWSPILHSEGGIPEITTGDIGMEELWGYAVFE